MEWMEEAVPVLETQILFPCSIHGMIESKLPSNNLKKLFLLCLPNFYYWQNTKLLWPWYDFMLHVKKILLVLISSYLPLFITWSLYRLPISGRTKLFDYILEEISIITYLCCKINISKPMLIKISKSEKIFLKSCLKFGSS